MFKFLRDLLDKVSLSKPVVKKTTTTLTPATVHGLKGQLKTDLESIIEKMRKKEGVTLPEISLVMSDLFDQRAVSFTTQKLREVILKDSIFIIDEVRLVSKDANSKPTNLQFKLKELVFNMDMEISVPAAHFHEIFRPIDLTHLEKTGTKNDNQN